MSFTPEQFKELDAALHVNAIKTREQSGQTLSYVDAHYVTDRLNKILKGDWSRSTDAPVMIQCELKEKKNNKGETYEQWYVGYTARCTFTAGGITRDGYGYGQGIDRDLGRAHESAIKEAETDAFKRAVMTLGNSMGLALYDKSKAHVEAPVIIRPLSNQQMIDFFNRGEFTVDQKKMVKARCEASKDTPGSWLAKCAHDGDTDALVVMARLDREYPAPTPTEASVAAQAPLTGGMSDPLAYNGHERPQDDAYGNPSDGSKG